MWNFMCVWLYTIKKCAKQEMTDDSYWQNLFYNLFICSPALFIALVSGSKKSRLMYSDSWPNIVQILLYYRIFQVFNFRCSKYHVSENLKRSCKHGNSSLLFFGPDISKNLPTYTLSSKTTWNNTWLINMIICNFRLIFCYTISAPLFKIKKKKFSLCSLFPTTYFDQIYLNLWPK